MFIIITKKGISLTNKIAQSSFAKGHSSWKETNHLGDFNQPPVFPACWPPLAWLHPVPRSFPCRWRTWHLVTGDRNVWCCGNHVKRSLKKKTAVKKRAPLEETNILQPWIWFKPNLVAVFWKQSFWRCWTLCIEHLSRIPEFQRSKRMTQWCCCKNRRGVFSQLWKAASEHV